jgi:hypothetical protein
MLARDFHALVFPPLPINEYATLSHNTMPVYSEQILVEITKSLERCQAPHSMVFRKMWWDWEMDVETRDLRLGK